MFFDRIDAGKRLAYSLSSYKKDDVVVYAIPRGGVVVAKPICQLLDISLDLVITRKIGHPYNPELAIGAVSEHGQTFFDQHIHTEINPKYVEKEIQKQIEEAHRRRVIYMKYNEPIGCNGKIAIIVDDGVATGYTMKAAIREIQNLYHPQKIVIAVGVISKESAEEFTESGVEVVAGKVEETSFFDSVSQYYQQFPQIHDEEVVEIINSLKK